MLFYHVKISNGSNVTSPIHLIGLMPEDSSGINQTFSRSLPDEQEKSLHLWRICFKRLEGVNKECQVQLGALYGTLYIFAYSLFDRFLLLIMT